MSQFDARDFVKAIHARRRRKFAGALRVGVGAAGSAVLWIGLMSFDWRNRSQGNWHSESAGVRSVSAEGESPVLRPTIAPDWSSLEPQDMSGSPPDTFDTWILRPTLDPEPTELKATWNAKEGGRIVQLRKGSPIKHTSCWGKRRHPPPMS
jgi:hypothetical protein